MTESLSGGTPITFILILLAACVVLFLIGIALRRRGMLRLRGAWLVWSIITVLPLFGAAGLYVVKHQVERATGRDTVPPTGPGGAIAPASR